MNKKIIAMLLAIYVGWFFITHGVPSQNYLEKFYSPLSYKAINTRNERHMIHNLVQMCKQISRAHRYSRDSEYILGLVKWIYHENAFLVENFI